MQVVDKEQEVEFKKERSCQFAITLFGFSFLASDGEVPHSKTRPEKKALWEDLRFSINSDFLCSLQFYRLFYH